MYKIHKKFRLKCSRNKGCDITAVVEHKKQQERRGRQELRQMWNRTAEMREEKTARKAKGKSHELAQEAHRKKKRTLVCGPTQQKINQTTFVIQCRCSQGTTTNLLEKYGVANVILADGPAGIRITSHYRVKNPSNMRLSK